MKFGDRDESVRALQRGLLRTGRNPGPVDGWLGDLTWRALAEHDFDRLNDTTVPPETIASLPPPASQIPTGAFFVDRAGSVVIYDVTRLLPSAGTYPERTRDLEGIVVHHSGGDGPAGYAGLRAHAAYCVDHHGWAGAAYHYWVSAFPDRDSSGRIVVYRANPDDELAWATGGANAVTLGIGVQGNLSSREPTPSQIKALDALVPWLVERAGLDRTDVGYHSEAGRWGGRPKASCPGPALTRYVDDYRKL